MVCTYKTKLLSAIMKEVFSVRGMFVILHKQHLLPHLQVHTTANLQFLLC